MPSGRSGNLTPVDSEVLGPVSTWDPTGEPVGSWSLVELRGETSRVSLDESEVVSTQY